MGCSSSRNGDDMRDYEWKSEDAVWTSNPRGSKPVLKRMPSAEGEPSMPGVSETRELTIADETKGKDELESAANPLTVGGSGAPATGTDGGTDAAAATAVPSGTAAGGGGAGGAASVTGASSPRPMPNLSRAASTTSTTSSGAPVVPFSELRIKRTLGTGAFGRVRLAYHEPSGKTYALKIMQKAWIKLLHQEKNIIREKDMLHSINHPFIVGFEGTYQDANRLYLLMELVQGGELYYQMRDSPLGRGRLPLPSVKFYAACVVLALKYLQKRFIAHRDLRPENLLIAPNGYLKMIDFGYAKVVKAGTRTYTLCGSSEYLAPECVNGGGHGIGVDIWALGVLLYHMTCGSTPFTETKEQKIKRERHATQHDSYSVKDASINREEGDGFRVNVFTNIMRGKIDFTKFHKADEHLEDLISRILVKDPKKRFGCGKRGVDDIMGHPFFADVDFDAVGKMSVTAPWTPPLKDPLDTSCFDKFDEKDPCIPYSGEAHWCDMF